MVMNSIIIIKYIDVPMMLADDAELWLLPCHVLNEERRPLPYIPKCACVCESVVRYKSQSWVRGQ